MSVNDTNREFCPRSIAYTKHSRMSDIWSAHEMITNFLKFLTITVVFVVVVVKTVKFVLKHVRMYCVNLPVNKY